ncbi:MAG: hypothetical protein A2Y15_01440 [Clostridiales bacterium GWF2_36_10]|nr:MAG: hypothetical protein A2Y15_01440 [Clostridiales bacterium GWF2_36_10]HAN22064.1 hypothetical protein [Clostridiales bacterium]
MKKIISLVLVLLMATTIFVLPTSAAAYNTEVNIKYIATAPKIDGTVKTGEYGLKVHSTYDSNKADQFITDYDTDKDIDADFYMTYDKNYLYIAWVVKTDIHFTLDPTVDYDKKNDGFTENDLRWMWEYCCVQFILTPSGPKEGKTDFQGTAMYGDFLEVGLQIIEGNSRKTQWCLPTNGQGLTSDDWDFAGSRDDAKKLTTYEIRLPWEKTGITQIGNGKQFGLTYAIGDQENFTTVGNNMVEWQDGILGTKDADKSGVITLTDFPGEDIEISVDNESKELEPIDETQIPEVATTFTIDGINKSIAAEASALITKIENYTQYNLNYTLNIVARPVEGKDNTYAVVSTEQASSSTPPTIVTQEGDIILAFHSDGAGGAGEERKLTAAKLAVGDELVLLGIDVANEEFTNTGALVYVEKELSSDPIDESTDDVSGESTEPSADESEDASEAISDEANSKAEPEAESEFPWLIVGIAGGVIIVAAGLYFFVFKKKEA